MLRMRIKPEWKKLIKFKYRLSYVPTIPSGRNNQEGEIVALWPALILACSSYCLVDVVNILYYLRINCEKTLPNSSESPSFNFLF